MTIWPKNLAGNVQRPQTAKASNGAGSIDMGGNKERANRDLRVRIKRLNRKNLCFSRPEKMHNKDTETFIERENYKLYLIYVSNYLIHDQSCA
ncbi:hypothetical protein ID850_17035 [Xenorhabdus sp. Flor]|uniref:IS1 family transposase n=1 Tax=Xenorhabdus cabanillasii TaxID=351673 RepID=UPI0019A07FC0|nr:hypothetical protein [Xenorhabdus sp. Flor]